LSVETLLDTPGFATGDVAQRRFYIEGVWGARIGKGTTSVVPPCTDLALRAAVGLSLAAIPVRVDEDSNPRITC
jgi:hypothetical protein